MEDSKSQLSYYANVMLTTDVCDSDRSKIPSKQKQTITWGDS